MSATISPSLGFCQRCGDPTNKFRCCCGGTPGIRTTSALPVAKKADPWANRYVNPHSPFSPSHQGEEEEAEEYLHNQPPPLSPKRTSYDPSIGFGMPSRISRDLRTSIQPNPSSLDLSPTPSNTHTRSVSPSNLTPAIVEQKRSSNDYSAPLITGSDGVLSKVCGSLVEPSTTRNKWACTGCNSIFARDSTIYAAPSSLQSQDSSYYCKDCYSNKYSLGDCSGCNRPVLGSTKQDGKFVKASGGIWHARCWKCQHCGENEGVLVGMQARPVCERCFERPKRQPSPLPPSNTARQDLLPEVRRLTKVAGREGAMRATIAELTKKFGQTSLSSPHTGFRSSLNISIPRSGSSQSSMERLGSSPRKDQLNFSTNVSASSMARSGSLTGSPPKPRPLTARFREGMDLAAFQPSYADQGLLRKGSRSRSVSPAKRGPLSTPFGRAGEVERVSPSSSLEAKVPGSPSLNPVTSSSSSTGANPLVVDEPRRKTSSAYPRPLNFPVPATEPSEPKQGEKSGLEPVQGTVRCSACGLLPFEKSTTEGKEAGEVVMVTLRTGVHLHADCFRCSICTQLIDGEKTFVRLDEDKGEGVSYAHPHCSPSIQLKVVRTREEGGGVEKGQKSYRTSLDPNSAREGGTSHPTHQRELKPSPTPSPSTSLRDRSLSGMRASIIPTESNTKGEVRRFQPTAGAATLTRSTILSSHSSSSCSTALGAKNPAAGIFTRPTTSVTTLTPTPNTTSKRVLGGMQTCAFCGEKLSTLESVLGPRGTQWHKNCLICRAPPPEKKEVYGWRKKEPIICGKKLDSGAKVNQQGEVRCRDCYGRECSSFRIKA